MLKRKSLTSTPKNPKKPPDISFNIEDKRATPLSEAGTHSEHLESQYIDNVHKELFFELCDSCRLNINTIFTRMLTLREKHRLNIFLRTAKERHGIRIMDSLIYLEEKHAKFNQLLKCLDQENEFILKTEASDINVKYKIPNNYLKDFLEFEKK